MSVRVGGIVHHPPASPGGPATEVRFGFLPTKESWRGGDYVIEPVENFDSVVNSVLDFSHEANGLYYPPSSRTVDQDGVVRPRSRGIARLFPMASTHRIRRVDGSQIQESEAFRAGEGAVIIGTLGLLHEARCQFESYYQEGPVPTRLHPIGTRRPGVFDEVLRRVVDRCRAHPDLAVQLPHLLFMKTRVVTYHWAWEQFLVEYVVFDALWKIATEITRVAPKPTKPVGHAKRFEYLGRNGLISWDSDEQRQATEFASARNLLAHEALFVAAGSTVLTPHRLGKLTTRLFFSALDIDRDFGKSEWGGMGSDILRCGL